MSRLQALCRPGDHDQAEVHDSPQDVQHYPYWLQVKSFYEEKRSRSPEASVTSQQDKGKTPISSASSQYPPTVCSYCYKRQSSSVNSGSPPSLTPDSMMPHMPNTTATTPGPSRPSASPSAPPGLMLPNDHGAGAFNGYAPSYGLASGYQGSTPGHYPWPGAYPWPGFYLWPVPAPSFPTFANVIVLCGGCAASFGAQLLYLPASPSMGSLWHTQGPSFSLPIRPHPRYTAESGTTSVPSHQSYSLWAMHMPPESSNMSHYIFAVFDSWRFTAVEVARHPCCRTSETTPIGAYPLCRCRIETVCYLPASDDGTEGIPPLPQSVPGAPLLSRRNSGNHSIHITNGGADTYRYCPVQLYLSSMEGKGDAKRFSYRNDKMHFNQMIELQLDVESLARRVAVALALMHWFACIDARGVQFYLVSSWKSGQREQLLAASSEPGKPSGSLARGHTSLRVGHFEEAQTIKMDEDGVELAVEAAKRSLYIPRPNQRLSIQKRTWDAFVSSYIAASDIILRQRGERKLRLPRILIHKIIQEEPYWPRS